ncbi:FixH family protein [Dictyobacter halimunensis]
MRIRPFFWLILGMACICVIMLAFLYQPYVPASLQVQMEQKQFMVRGPSTLKLQLTDPDGLPIDEARVIPSAHMTNMDMMALHNRVVPHGHGIYEVNLDLSMAGPWAITIQTQARGFSPQQQTLQVNVL